MKKNNIKVIFIARRFPPSIGGMERFAYDLSGSVQKQISNLYLVTWGKSNKYIFLIAPLLLIRAQWRMVFEPFDVIHIQDALLSPIGWILHLTTRRPYVVIAHGLDITYSNKLYQKVIPWFLKRSSSVIAISRATADEVIKRGVSQEKVHTIPLGITDDTIDVLPDKSKLGARVGVDDLSSKNILLTVGRLVKRKGVNWFINECMPEIVKMYPNALYIVVGEGQERKAIESSVKQCELEKHVLLLGEISEELKMLLYKSCDVFVMPNIPVAGDMEGFGRVAHEAAVAGMPVVASGIEGIADAITNGKNGVLVKPEDTESYITNISKFLKNNKIRKNFGENSRKYTMDTYGWTKVARLYVDVYRKILAKK